MHRLYTRIYLYSIAVLLVTAVVVALVGAVTWRGEHGRRLAERLTGLAANLLAERFDDAPSRQQLVQRLAHDLDVDITVRSPDGEVLVSAGRPLPEAPRWQRRWRGPHFVGRRHRWFAISPVRDPQTGELLGMLQAAPRSPPPSPPFLRLGLILTGVLVALGLLAWPLARHISRPVERLTAASRRFGAGELGHRIELVGMQRADELFALSVAWNEMAERIEKLVASQRELLANVSHELRSPLARMRVLLELLPKGEGEKERLQEVEGEIAELDRLVDDVLTSSRLDMGSLPLTKTPLHVQELLETLAAEASSLPSVAGKELSVVVDPTLTLAADRTLLRRAVWNLLDNAGKYGAPPLRLEAHAEGDEVRIAVVDNGPGLSPQERARVVEPFYRTSAARRGGALGVGLGLTLVSRIAAAHGGRLELASEPASGLRASLVLPRG